MNKSYRRTVTDRSGAILSHRSRRRRAQRRSRFMRSIDYRLSQLSNENLGIVYGAMLAMNDEKNGKLSPDDAAQYRTLHKARPIDMDAIEAWLNAHGYLESANSL